MDAFVRSPSEPVSVVLELAGSLEKVQAEHVGEACRMGDRLAEAILRQTADLLVVWLGNMIDLLEPDAIVLGGGVTELIGTFLDYISEQLPAWTLNPRVNEIPLLRARYGIEAGMAGAAALMFT